MNDMDHLIATWVPTAAFILTGLGIVVKLSAVVTRLDTLLGELTDRVVKLEAHVYNVSKLPVRRKRK